jgi:hypothetical protein
MRPPIVIVGKSAISVTTQSSRDFNQDKHRQEGRERGLEYANLRCAILHDVSFVMP